MEECDEAERIIIGKCAFKAILCNKFCLHRFSDYQSGFGHPYPAVSEKEKRKEKCPRMGLNQRIRQNNTVWCTKNAFRRLWVTHSLFVGRNLCDSCAILFFGDTQKGVHKKWIKLRRENLSLLCGERKG